MRLSPSEIRALVDVMATFVGGLEAELYLFGSRTNDKLKGGDIDLLLLVPSIDERKLNSRRHVILAQLKKHLGDRKIDLTISAKEKASSEPFLIEALRSAVSLGKWGLIYMALIAYGQGPKEL